MADPAPSRTTGKWLWPLLIALLAILLLVWVFSPSGDRDGQVEDPILTPEVSEPEAGLTGDGLPTGAEATPVGPDAPMADTTVEREPTDEPVEVVDPAIPLPNAAGQGQ